MSDPSDSVPPPDSPPLNGGRFGRPTPRTGAGRLDTVPRMENVRVTAPDLARRSAMEKTRSRLVIAAAGFLIMFTAVFGKLTLATVVMPLPPHRVEKSVAAIVAASEQQRNPIEATMPGQRAMITDRNGQPMAISLNTVALFADPRQIANPEEVARELKQVLPRLDIDDTTDRLKREKKFVYLAREITPREQLQINNLGIPGVDFEPT
jgi:cell division protein FtsI (penicillin-binding protein 3)